MHRLTSGAVPPGYDLHNRTLTINEAEAEQVRTIYPGLFWSWAVFPGCFIFTELSGPGVRGAV